MSKTQHPATRWQPPFFALWVGQAASLLTSELVQFALPVWLLGTSGSAAVVANAATAALVPRAVLGPFAGALVDRWNRRLVMIVSDAITALALISLACLFSVGTIQVWHVYVVVLVRALAGCFQMPAMFATTSLMVPEKHLSRIAGMNQLMKGLVFIAAPLLGALLMSVLPLQGIIALDVGGAILAILPLLFLHLPQPHAPHTLPTEIGPANFRSSMWRDLGDGLRYIWNWKGAAWMLLLSIAINFISRPAFSLALIPLTQHFGGSKVEYGYMMAAFGVGLVMGGLVLSVWGGFRRQMQTSLVGVVGMGVAVLTIGVVPKTALPLAIVGMFAGGFMTPLTMGPIQALVQSVVEPGMQGRVVTILDSASTAIAPLSTQLAGSVFENLGSQAWYTSGGLIAVLIGLAGFATPMILNLGAPERRVSGEIEDKMRDAGGEHYPARRTLR